MFCLSLKVCAFLLCIVCSSSHDAYNVAGTTSKGWKFVRELFRENFIIERDLGASLAIYHQGESVVDLRGGWFDHSKTKPYDSNTLQLVFSTTKGVTAIAAALCVKRGWLNYSELVTKYWPEYGKHGKERTTVADILSHRAGLPTESGSAQQQLNWTAMVELLENATPMWPPGATHSYHSPSYDWLASELIRRADPKKRSVGQFVHKEIVWPLKLEFYIGLPPSQASCVSPLTFSSETGRMLNASIQSAFAIYNVSSVQQAEILAPNGITTARSLARLYASLITDIDNGRRKQLLSDAMLKQVIRPVNVSHLWSDDTTGSMDLY